MYCHCFSGLTTKSKADEVPSSSGAAPEDTEDMGKTFSKRPASPKSKEKSKQSKPGKKSKDEEQVPTQTPEGVKKEDRASEAVKEAACDTLDKQCEELQAAEKELEEQLQKHVEKQQQTPTVEEEVSAPKAESLVDTSSFPSSSKGELPKSLEKTKEKSAAEEPVKLPSAEPAPWKHVRQDMAEKRTAWLSAPSKTEKRPESPGEARLKAIDTKFMAAKRSEQSHSPRSVPSKAEAQKDSVTAKTVIQNENKASLSSSVVTPSAGKADPDNAVVSEPTVQPQTQSKLLETVPKEQKSHDDVKSKSPLGDVKSNVASRQQKLIKSSLGTKQKVQSKVDVKTTKEPVIDVRKPSSLVTKTVNQKSISEPQKPVISQTDDKAVDVKMTYQPVQELPKLTVKHVVTVDAFSKKGTPTQKTVKTEEHPKPVALAAKDKSKPKDPARTTHQVPKQVQKTADTTKEKVTEQSKQSLGGDSLEMAADRPLSDEFQKSLIYEPVKSSSQETRQVPYMQHAATIDTSRQQDIVAANKQKSSTLPAKLEHEVTPKVNHSDTDKDKEKLCNLS